SNSAEAEATEESIEEEVLEQVNEEPEEDEESLTETEETGEAEENTADEVKIKEEEGTNENLVENEEEVETSPQVQKASASPVVHFEDELLLEAVLDELGSDGDQVTEEEMLGLTELFARSMYIGDPTIKSLKGLETAKNLITLNLGSNDIEDLSPLAGLSNLNSLNLN